MNVFSMTRKISLIVQKFFVIWRR